jgi:hypothetical protein
MIRRLSSRSGQLLVPMAGLVLLFGLLSAGYVKWCRALYWRMRMDMVADATALSAARAQAQMLNRISFANTMINGCVAKMRVPFTDYQVGEISVQKYPEFRTKVQDLRAKVAGFKTYPAGVGQIVARANGAEGISPYFPMNSYLQPMTVHLLVVSKVPPVAYYRIVEGAYYARVWSPSFRKAQPPHRTTWLVRCHGFRAMSTARLWLDVPVSSWLHNGGFPRVREPFAGDVGIQNLFPQFNARLASRLRLTPEGLIQLWTGRGGASDAG